MGRKIPPSHLIGNQVNLIGRSGQPGSSIRSTWSSNQVALMINQLHLISESGQPDDKPARPDLSTTLT
jgi:hypothetical protein